MSFVKFPKINMIRAIQGLGRSSLSSKASSRSLAVFSAKTSKPSMMSSCIISRNLAGSPAAGIHTKVDTDLINFLEGEIRAEKDQSNVPKNGPGVPGFEVKAVGSRITLIRKQNEETITVKLNVNASVDAEGPSEEELEAAQAQGQSPDASMIGDMKSRPDFIVEVAKPNGRILAFNCRLYSNEELPQDQPEADKFEIEGFTILNAEDIDEDGDWSDNLYVGDAGIFDGQMYDLLMNFLDSRGIGNEFVDQMVDYATFYEHSKYINLLDNLKSFLSGK